MLHTLEMPNVRKKSKKYVSAWIDEALFAELEKEADRRRISLTELYVEKFKSGVLPPQKKK